MTSKGAMLISPGSFTMDEGPKLPSASSEGKKTTTGNDVNGNSNNEILNVLSSKEEIASSDSNNNNNNNHGGMVREFQLSRPLRSWVSIQTKPDL
jgi:hypothetical protein